MDYPIYENLKQLKISGDYPFHMPGHKRKKQEIFSEELYNCDITEITGYDDLHQPEDMIRETMDFMKKIYRSDESYFLINSSTGGILAGISSVCEIGDEILVARNCHKSVYHGIQLLGLKPRYIYPEVKDDLCQGISPTQIKDAMKQCEDVKAVVIVSPTYEGLVSDVRAIASFLHEKGIPLIVDEAHGAHFAYHKAFPESAVNQGADLVIQSLHKTLPSLTQTGLLHWKQGLIPKKKVEEYLGIYQSSSPSYIFMTSIDYCVRMCHERQDLFDEYVKNLYNVRQCFTELEHLSLLESDDIGKIVISTKGTNISGHELFEILRDEYHLELEMSELSYVIAMTSICDGMLDFLKLKDAIFSIDKTLIETEDKYEEFDWIDNPVFDTPNEAKRKPSKLIAYEDSAGYISADFIYLYPPGIPLVVPGEQITERVIERLRLYIDEDMKIVGLKDLMICVIDERN